ncbi:hypothetical protein BJX62DRAFT_246796 [Aspergillus germanicus]
MAHLPLEILHMVAANLQSNDSSLTRCILVCRSWRAAFEPMIYSKLRISTTRTSSIGDKRVLPIDEFDKLTSGAGTIRRSWIQHINCKIVVPHLLNNYTTVVDGNYDLDNPVRRADDMALHLSVDLSIHGEELCVEEPETCDALDTREFDYEPQDSENIVPPYAATLAGKSLIDIPKVVCIKRLSVPRFEEHQIGAGAALEIVSCCPGITEVELALDYYIRPDHLEYIQARRLAIASGLQGIPASLRVLHYYSQREEPWIECLPVNLRYLSYQLLELHLDYACIETDFLCPLDNSNRPTGDVSVSWPNLEKIISYSHPPVLPSGVWLMDLTLETIYGNDSAPQRHEMDHEAFHRIFISVGYAARRMPRLKRISFLLGFHVHNYFTCLRSGARTALKWWGGPYSPDNNVARAWGFQADSVRVTGSTRFRNVEAEVY